MNDQYARTRKQPTWQCIAQWFKEKYEGKIISQSTISSVLLKRSADSALLSQPAFGPEIKRRRNVAWPQLDSVLFEWYERLQRRTTITGLVLKEKAREFFEVLYPGMFIKCKSEIISDTDCRR